MRRWLAGLLIVLAACGGGTDEPGGVEAYLKANPNTLLDNAQAMRRGELIPGMVDREVAVLLGAPRGSVMRKGGGRQRVVASYKADCRFVREGKAAELKGPVSLVYELHESGEWRLVTARSIWR